MILGDDRSRVPGAASKCLEATRGAAGRAMRAGCVPPPSNTDLR